MKVLSIKAKQICKENYSTNCGVCPLRSACVATIGYGLTGVNKWTTKVNKLAEKIQGGSQI